MQMHSHPRQHGHSNHATEELPRIQIIRPKNQQQTRHLQGEPTVKLQGLGGEPDPFYYPLQLCQGDCDNDKDCDVGLVCFQREPKMDVPGCIGGIDEYSKTDFCIPDSAVATNNSTAIDPTKPHTPLAVGVDVSSPTALIPVELDEDATVAPSFAPTAKPTTLSTTANATAATLSPTAAETTSAPTPTATFEYTEAPTMTDEPTSAAPFASTEVPTTAVPIAQAAVTGTLAPSPAGSSVASPSAAGTTSPTTSTLPELDRVANNGSPSDAYPLGLCQGDCDDDEDCATGLICFQRDANDPVPGCIGEDRSRNDYCIVDPAAAIPTASPTISIPPTAMPSTMAPTNSNEPTLVPTVSGVPTSFPSDFPSMLPTEPPSLTPTLSPYPTISPIPTITPSHNPTMQAMEGVRLKMYWEQGYNWQDEYVERKWCMISNYRGFPGTGKCWHELKTEPCHQDMLYIARCDTDKRQMLTIIPMPGGSQFQISLYGENTCLERLEYSLVLRECNYMNPLQRFWIPRGAVYQKRFELSPITLANHCVTQAHHPKSGEVVQLSKCSVARSPENLSSFWNVY